jgi:phosphoribosylglycinamide formyltransferase-1
MINLAVFASGRGSNLGALLQHVDAGDLAGLRVRLVISNNSRSGALETARVRGIETLHISSRTHPTEDRRTEATLQALKQRRIHLIVLAGYMKRLPPQVVRAYTERIVNIHPALLPRHGGQGMYGLAVHRSVLDSGDKETGVTVHLVNEDYDQGAILAQRRLPVLPDDSPESLAGRVLELEHDLYWRVVKEVAAGLQG